MPLPRFVPVIELPDDWSGALTVAVHQGNVVVLDDHPDDVAADAPRLLLGTLDGAACWAVDLDGDGVPDEPQALTAAKAAGRVVRPFRSVDLDGDGVPDEPLALTAMKGVGKTIASPFKPGSRGRHIFEGRQKEPDSGPDVTPAREG